MTTRSFGFISKLSSQFQGDWCSVEWARRGLTCKPSVENIQTPLQKKPNLAVRLFSNRPMDSIGRQALPISFCCFFRSAMTSS
jgi:hypothetical protein